MFMHFYAYHRFIVSSIFAVITLSAPVSRFPHVVSYRREKASHMGKGMICSDMHVMWCSSSGEK